jgi:cob(I)alamin adenosyltransferase
VKIYTKTGDSGQTSLVGGTRVSKDDARIEAYGTIDELNSNLGVLVALDSNHSAFLKNIQHRLFDVGSILAAELNLEFDLPNIDESDVLNIENEIDRLNKSLSRLKNFILPGGSVLSAHTHIARCVCRRAERRIVALADDTYSIHVKYLNRLSDYLFVLSREYLRLEGKEEIIWQKKD